MVWGSLECCFGAADFECIADKGSPPAFPPIFDFGIEFWSYIVCFLEHFCFRREKPVKFPTPLGNRFQEPPSHRKSAKCNATAGLGFHMPRVVF